MVREYRTSDKYVFFMQGPLGNWYGDHSDKSIIHLWNKQFRTSEHLFMYFKAVHFGDVENMEKIENEPLTAYEVKAVGRAIKGFNEKEWDAVKKEAMMLALRLKYDWCTDFRETLMAEEYRGKTFVECNLDDKVWAIGKSLESEGIEDEGSWNGRNLLGECLTELRHEKLLEKEMKNRLDSI